MGRGSGQGGGRSAFAIASTGVGRFLGAGSPGAQYAQAFENYTFSSYEHMNAYMRMGHSAFAARHGAKSAKIARSLVTDMSRSVRATMEAGHVYTGKTYRGSIATKDEFSRMVTTGTYVTKSFTSTSVSRSVAVDFASSATRKSQDDLRVVYHFNKSRGVPLQAVSGFGKEKESLLPHGQRYRYLSHKEDRKSGITHVYLDEW